MKCSKCGATENLVVVGWMHKSKLKCVKCSEKPNYNVVAEEPTASDDWNARAKEVNGRLMAKYAR